MRFFMVAAVLFAIALVCGSAAAQDTEALRRELEQMRQQFENAQKTIESLSERLKRLESQPAPAPSPAPPATTPPVVGPAPVAPAPTSLPSLTDLVRPRPPFSLYERRGAGQLLFDMGIAGDFVGNITQRNVAKANGGSFPGQENRFFPREVEVSLFGQVDPYAYAEMRIETGEEERGAETAATLAEAFITLLTLPYGTQAKLGQMRNRFGYSNQAHEHDLPWIDRPNVLRNFFGSEGLQEKGAEFTIVPPLPFYLEGLVGVFNGDNETAFGRGSIRDALVTGRLRTFLEMGDTSALQLGVSAASGQTPDRLRSTILGFDARYKYRPVGLLHPLLTLTGEALYSMRRQNVEVDDDGDGISDRLDKRTRDRFGWYAGVEVQPFRRWAAGVRYDWSQFPLAPGREWALEPYLTFFPSEFLRFRLAYKHTDRSHRDGFTLNEGSARIVDELLFQATFILGAHPAHPF